MRELTELFFDILKAENSNFRRYSGYPRFSRQDLDVQHAWTRAMKRFTESKQFLDRFKALPQDKGSVLEDRQ